MSRDELDAWVRTRVDGEIQNILDEFDADRDGSISMDEFLTDGGGESTPSSDQESGKEDDTGPEGSSDAVDHSSMTVAQLKGLLREAGRPVSGKKAELIERLQE